MEAIRVGALPTRRFERGKRGTMKPGDKVRQPVPEEQAFPMIGIEAVIIEVTDKGLIVEFMHPYEKEIVQQLWPKRWKLEIVEEA